MKKIKHVLALEGLSTISPHFLSLLQKKPMPAKKLNKSGCSPHCNFPFCMCQAKRILPYSVTRIKAANLQLQIHELIKNLIFKNSFSCSWAINLKIH